LQDEFWRKKAIFKPEVLDRIESSLSNLSRKKIQDSAGSRRASVLVPLCNRNGIASVLFTKRADTLSLHKVYSTHPCGTKAIRDLVRHQGEVSFPGGLEETADEGNVIKTALRETEEELGYGNARNMDVLGLWHDALRLAIRNSLSAYH